MKRDWLVYLVIFSLALNLGTIGTFAYLRYQDNRGQAAVQAGPPLPMRALWRDLKLDNAQRQAMHRLFPEHRRRVEAIRRELAQKRQELFDLIKAEATPWGAIRAKIQEISALQGGLEEEMARFMLEFKKNLKPAQYAAFMNQVQNRLGCRPKGPWGPGRHGGGPHGPGGPGMEPGGGPGMGPPGGPGMGPGGGPMGCPPK
jgi:Spy/CpxP family protein refolding chaperone